MAVAGRGLQHLHPTIDRPADLNHLIDLAKYTAET